MAELGAIERLASSRRDLPHKSAQKHESPSNFGVQKKPGNPQFVQVCVGSPDLSTKKDYGIMR
jgi:hypothetical protein